MSILKKPYEISIWDDVLVFRIFKDGAYKDILSEEAEGIKEYDIKYQYYKEKKIAIIGSDTMSAPWRAVNPTFVKNVNGSSTLTFTMYSKYYDEDKDELLDNPFVKKMVNERKIKLKYDGEWYDFIIKNIEESSDNKTYTYTAKDLFINELSKTGYDLVFDSKLENNLGTIDELADEILEGSDWARKDGDIIRQYKEEPLYEIIVEKEFTAHRMLGLENEIGDNEITLKTGNIIYGFYKCINSKDSFFQFLYEPNGEYETDDDRVIINIPNYYISNAIDSNGNFKYFNIEKTPVVTDKYRGKRLVRNITTKYDPVMDKYVNVYTNADKETIYGYTEYEYLTSNTVRNYIVNPTAYTSTDGWSTSAVSALKLMTDPPLNEGTIDSDFKTYLKWLGSNYLINSCITENRSTIKNFAKGEKYTIRIKYGYLKNNGEIDFNISSSANRGLNFYIAEYNLGDNGYYIVNNNILFTFEHSNFKEDDKGYRYYTASCEKTVSYDDLLNHKYGLLIKEVSPLLRDYCVIEDIQFFKCVEDSNGSVIYPNTNIESEAKIKYVYYRYDPTIKDPNLIQPIYQGYTESPEYDALYNKNCEKQRSIQASESNRFNLIQSLCETFECWAKFEIEHNENTGEISTEIIIDEDTGEEKSCRQKKWVSFHEYIGNENFIGFKYGINLKSIKRSIDSESIATKLIVKNNSNEYADGGFCSIATASENPTGENFLLDFSHYINQGLLNFSQFNNDLYLDTAGYLGYYKKLRNINQNIEENAKLQAELVSKTLPTLRSQYSTYKVAIDSGKEQLESQKNQIYQTTGLTLDELLGKHKDSNWWQDDGVYSLILSTIRLEKNIKEYEKLLEAVKNSLYGKDWSEDSTGTPGGAEGKLKELENNIKSLVEKKKTYHQEFYQKYSRYIQEGSWISEDYIDDNLYYLDAESTLHTSSQPKVTYTINVLELSQVEGFECYQFNVGDKTFIEDTEFFGWVDQIHSTPYKEEVVVSEVKVALDDPTQNTITVKNYKTQFEDLFQRITATTTAVQFSTGEYQRAAGVVESDGSLSASAVQNSIFNNSIILSNSNNESVLWDETGITTTSVNKPNEMVRIVGGGIFLSKDFGTSWSTGITGGGINANFINAGQIDTNLVRIMNGSYPTFRWDSSGLSAYYFKEEGGAITNYSQSKFVRLDQFGLYGIDSNSAFNVFTPDENGLVGEDKIKKHSHFYLTWSGFGIKTNNGVVSITSENDFEVKDSENKTRVKIGSLGGGLFGMRLFDNSGNTTLETGSQGQLYLKDTIKIGPSVYDPRVTLGPSAYYNENDKEVENRDEAKYSKIFSVLESTDGAETIAFYDNGLLVATNAIIIGTLEAGSIVSEGSIISGGCNISGSSGLTIGDIAITASGIKASIDGAGLSFDSNGLTIENSGQGGIRIIRIEGEEYHITEDTTVDPNKIYYILNEGIYTKVSLEAGSEFPSGNEYYEKTVIKTPVLIADTEGDAYFAGTIEAESGTIGDIKIGNGGLFYSDSEGGPIVFSLNSDGLVANSGLLGNLSLTGDLTLKSGGKIIGKKQDGKEGFIISGENGSIIANSIELGEAKLNNYLKMGEYCWIFNPDKYSVANDVLNGNSKWQEDSFININYLDGDKIKNAVSITKDGCIKLSGKDASGIVVLDGKKGAIYGGGNSANSGTYWQIDGNSATFNNITARGSLKCAVLEKGKIQSVGGMVLIRPSSIIKDAQKEKLGDKEYKYTLTLENASEFHGYDYCKIQTLEKNYTIRLDNVDENKNKVTFTVDKEIEEELIGASIISFCQQRPNSIVKNAQKESLENAEYKYTLTLENISEFNSGDYCKIKTLSYDYNIKLDGVNENENKVTFTIDEEIREELIGASIISFCQQIPGSTVKDAQKENLVNHKYKYRYTLTLWDVSEFHSLGYCKIHTSEKNYTIQLDGVNESKNKVIFTTNEEIKEELIDAFIISFFRGRARNIIKDAQKENLENAKYKYTLILDSASEFYGYDYCKIQTLNNNYTIKLDDVDASEDKVFFTIDKEIEENLIGATIIGFSQELENKLPEPSFGIGLNASTNSSLIPERAMSLVSFEYDNEKNDILGNNKIILGYIPSISTLYGSIAGQYGLYADNVLVKGKLVSGVGNNYNELVSGIDSLSSVTVPTIISEHFDKSKRNGKIIFWAGAPGTDNIQASPFWVDSYGNMYAGSGYFKGAILTESTIEAAEIKTATITGTNDAKDYALKIRNDSENNSKAIRFFSAENKNGREIETNYFTLSSEELRLGTNTKISFEKAGNDTNNTVIKRAEIISQSFKAGTSTADENRTLINDNSIGFNNGINGLNKDDNSLSLIKNNDKYIDLTDKVSILKRLSIESEFDLWNTIEIKQIKDTNNIIGFDIEFRK